MRFDEQKQRVMKRFLFIVMALFLGFSSEQVLHAQAPTAPDEKRAAQPRKRGGIFTMYALDPLARTLCFSDGKEGMVFQNSAWRNRCSDLSMSGSNFLSGIEGNRLAVILDLGTADDLSNRNGFEDQQKGGTGFASLHLQGDKVMVLKEDIREPQFQPLQEGPKLFSELTANAHAPIKLGHIYLVRVADKKDLSFQQIVKLMVIAYRPDESVTLRWELL